MGKVVHKLKAIDPDEKPVLRYKVDRDSSEARNEDGAVVKITEYDFVSAFELNSVDGTLKVSRLIDREKVETIKLTLVVEDLAATNGKQVSSGEYATDRCTETLLEMSSQGNRSEITYIFGGTFSMPLCMCVKVSPLFRKFC